MPERLRFKFPLRPTGTVSKMGAYLSTRVPAEYLGDFWGTRIERFANRTARGANFLFLGIVQIVGHQDVRCERVESKEFVFLLSFFPVFRRPVVGARMHCTGFSRSTNRRKSAVSPGRTWFVDLRRFSCRPGSLGLLALSSKSGRWARDRTKLRILCHTNSCL